MLGDIAGNILVAHGDLKGFVEAPIGIAHGLGLHSFRQVIHPGLDIGRGELIEATLAKWGRLDIALHNTLIIIANIGFEIGRKMGKPRPAPLGDGGLCGTEIYALCHFSLELLELLTGLPLGCRPPFAPPPIGE